jgi:hypothetical protein
MAAVAGEAGIAARAPNLGADPLGGTGLDHAGEIPPGDARQRRLRHGPGDILDVTRIDRGRHDPHQCRPPVDDWRADLHQFENGGIAERLELYRAHDLLLHGGACFREDGCA